MRYTSLILIGVVLSVSGLNGQKKKKPEEKEEQVIPEPAPVHELTVIKVVLSIKIAYLHRCGTELYYASGFNVPWNIFTASV